MKIKILGVFFDAMTRKQAEEKILQFVESGKNHFIVTPNPEFLVLAQTDKKFQNILNSADLSLADGMGILLASRVLNKKIPQRITGSDVIEILSKISEQKKCSLFLFGGKEGIASKAAMALKERFSNITIAGALDGGFLQDPENADGNICELIQRSGADILIVGLGHGKQEKFIYSHLNKFPLVKVAVGVGGALDFLAGAQKRAPYWMRFLGFEWLYRFIHQPSRSRRIFNAIGIFPFLVLKSLFLKHTLYEGKK